MDVARGLAPAGRARDRGSVGPARAALRRVVDGRRRTLWVVVASLIALPLAFAVNRVLTDVPAAVAGVVPAPDTFQRRYVLHLTPAYVHIAPGLVYLLGAPWQLSKRFRVRHLRL